MDNMDKEQENVEKAVNAAWAMFEQTGAVSYYILYKHLQKDKK